jgi:hypothetical protein
MMLFSYKKNEYDALISETGMIGVDTMFFHRLMLKAVFAMFFFITFDRKRWATINITLSLDMVIERISLSFVGYIATHQSHIYRKPTLF